LIASLWEILAKRLGCTDLKKIRLIFVLIISTFNSVDENRAMGKGMLRIDVVFVDFPKSWDQVHQNITIRILIHNDEDIFFHYLRGV